MSDTDFNGNASTHADDEPASALKIIHLPRTVDELLPPRPVDLVTQAAEMWASHYDDCLDLLLGISGEMPPIHGSGVANEWALVFKFQELCTKNGHAGLSTLNAAQLRRKMRAGLKRRTGHSFREIEHQGIRLRLEQRRVLPQAAE